MALAATTLRLNVFFKNIFHCLQLSSLLFIVCTRNNLSLGLFHFNFNHLMDIFWVGMLLNLSRFDLLLNLFGQILGVPQSWVKCRQMICSLRWQFIRWCINFITFTPLWWLRLVEWGRVNALARVEFLKVVITA